VTPGGDGGPVWRCRGGYRRTSLGSIFGGQCPGAEPAPSLRKSKRLSQSASPENLSRHQPEPRAPGGAPGRGEYRPALKEGTVSASTAAWRVQICARPVFARGGQGHPGRGPPPGAASCCAARWRGAAPTLKGGQVHFKVPPATQNGTKIRLRGSVNRPERRAPAGESSRASSPAAVRDEKTRKWAEEQPV